ncbi:MAG: recombinase RecA, partial [Candidatus Saccharimonadales bacterium]
EGISKTGDIIDLASESGIVEKTGAWYAYKGEKIAQGREAAKAYLKANPKLIDELTSAILDQSVEQD